MGFGRQNIKDSTINIYMEKNVTLKNKYKYIKLNKN
jgi:hypothetical protein